MAAYLDDVIVFNYDPMAHVNTMLALFERLREHNLKLSPPKSRLGATDVDFLGHSTSPTGMRPNAEKISALIKMPMPRDVKQPRALLGGVRYYRKLLRDLSKRIHPITSLLRRGVKFEFTPATEVVREILAELAAPPILAFPDWDAVADGSPPFHVYCDAFIDGFGAAYEQEQTDGSVRPIAYISRATPDFERRWTPLDVEAGSVVRAIKRLRGCLWSTKFRILPDLKALESIGKVGDHNARVQRWLKFLTAFDYTLENRKGSANGNAHFLSRLPESTTEHDRSGSRSLTSVENGDLFLIRASGLRIRSSPTPGAGSSGPVPRPESAGLGGLPFASSDFRDFRAHGPRMRIDDLSAPSGRFVARVSAAVTTTDRRPGRGYVFPAADTAFDLFFAVPSEGSTGSTGAPSAATAVAQHAPSPSSTSQEADSAVITDPAASTPSPPGDPAPPTAMPSSGRISTRTRRRTAAGASIEPPAVDYGFGPSGALHPPARRANTPPRVSRPRPPLAVVSAPAPAASPALTIPIPSGGDRAEPVGTPPLRFPPSADVPSATTAELDALGPAAELQFGDSTKCYSHADWAREQQAEPAFHVAMRYFAFARPLSLLADFLSCFSSQQRPSF